MRHQPDIDGLRAVAIIPVVLFHYRLGYVPGGFVGVDIFFVISGYLITGLLLGDLASSRFSIVRFYERRARRILPALFFMLVIVSVLAIFLLLPTDLENFGKSLIATTGFVSNVFYWSQSGYFARAAEFNPLLHTWSLAVEEQFYILFPLLVYLMRGLRAQQKFLVFAAATAISLAVSAWLSYSHPSAAFYFAVTRSWELTLGALVAASPTNHQPRRAAKEFLSIAGLLAILGSLVLINPSMPFPGWVAAIPCAGAALLLYCGRHGGGAGNRLLALSPFVFVGLVSYSVYLWHWPLHVLAQDIFPYGLTLLQSLLVLAATLAAGIFSWRYVERPFRGAASHFTRKRVFELAAVASSIAILGGGYFWLSKGLPMRFPGLAAMASAAQLAVPIFPECFSKSSAEVRSGKLCEVGARADVPASFIVWGDSHAQRFALPVAEVAAENGARGWLAAKGSCPPLLDVHWPVQDCGAFNDEVLQLIDRADSHVRYVFISALWAEYAEGTLFRNQDVYGGRAALTDRESKNDSAEEARRTFSRALLRTVEHLARNGKQVIVIGSVPEVGFAVPETLFKAGRLGLAPQAGPPREEFSIRQRSVIPVLKLAAEIPGVSVIDPSDVLCEVTCAVAQAGVPLYIDDNHLSRTGLDLVKPMIRAAFRP